MVFTCATSVLLNKEFQTKDLNWTNWVDFNWLLTKKLHCCQAQQNQAAAFVSLQYSFSVL